MKYSILAIFLFTSLFTLTSCASKPIVDLQGKSEATYKKDLAKCEQIASQVGKGQQAAKSGLFGAVVGGAIGLVTGNIRQAATIGAIQGTAGGTAKGDHNEQTVIRNCLRNRGYSVLN